MSTNLLTNNINIGKDQLPIDNKPTYVYISKKRLEQLEYIEKNLSTIIELAVLKSEETAAKKQ